MYQLKNPLFFIAITLVSAMTAFSQSRLRTLSRPSLIRPGLIRSGSSTQAADTPQAERPPLPKRMGISLPPAMKVQGSKAEDFKKISVWNGMVRISAGKCEGSSATDEDLAPYSLQIAAPFHMDQTEITWKLWKEVRDWAVTRPDIPEGQREFFKYDLQNSGSGKADDHPVQHVSWFECIKWCNARSEKDGLNPCYTVGGAVFRKGDGIPDCQFSAAGYRLPTTEEWEYAARGGLDNKRYPWGDTITHENANYFSTDNTPADLSKSRGSHPAYRKGEPPYTSPVASFPPNGYGLYDMAGNVWEWCWATKGSSRFVCGGSWDGDALGVRCGSRAVCEGSGNSSAYGGFRTVRRAGQ